jgi:hypothetical protein
MSRVKAALQAAKRIVGAESVAEKLARRKAESFRDWSYAVASTAAGEDVDLDHLVIAAGYIGISPSRVAETLAADARVWKEQAELAASSAASQKHADSLKHVSEAAAQRVEAERAALAITEREVHAYTWASVSAAHTEAAALQHRREHTRLWPADYIGHPDYLDDAVAVRDVDADSEPVAPRLIPADRVPLGTAAFVTD